MVERKGGREVDMELNELYTCKERELYSCKDKKIEINRERGDANTE